EMRRVAQEHLVLAARGLALDAVADHDRRAPASGDAAQLRRDGERRPAAPAERGALGEIGEVGGVRQRPEPLEVRAPRGPAVDAGEQPLGDHSLSARDDAATIPFTEPPAASIDSTNA